MAFVTESDVRAAALRARTINETASVVLRKSANSTTSYSRFDIFLSHSIRDADVVLGAKRLLEETGKRVYVDWVEDPSLDRNNITPATAELLRARMRQSDSLFYLHSASSGSSKWMPWELGYFDGYNGNVAIFPILGQGVTSFKGQEYLGLYPYVDITGVGSAREPFVHRNPKDYTAFTRWQTGADKKRPPA
ncbi:MAG: toll/interleukin-1 receptor domain-containing protein [Brevundimonas sp.]